MKQKNQIGKTKTAEFLDAKKGKTFVTPSGREYVFDYETVNRKTHVIIKYLGRNWRMPISDFNRINTDMILQSIEKTDTDSKRMEQEESEKNLNQ